MQAKTRSILCTAGIVTGTVVILSYLNGAAAQEKLDARPVPGNPNGANSFYLQPGHDPSSQKTRELLSQYNQTDDEAERAKIVKELTAVAAEEFDARQESREKQLQQLEEQLKKLRALHVRRSKEKDEIIRDRVRQLLRDADGLGWGSEGGSDAIFTAPRASTPVPPGGSSRAPGSQPGAAVPGRPRVE